jgi:malate synthase
MYEKVGYTKQMGRKFPALTYTEQDSDALLLIEKGSNTIRGARNLLSVALQYGNAFEQGMQAAALKPADFFGNDDILYLMEDMATGEIRLSILWEWLHKGAILSEDDVQTGVKEGDQFSLDLFERLLREEYEKLLNADTKDVFDSSKTTSLPISKEIVRTYVHSEEKFPWFIDLLNINLDNLNLEKAKQRISIYVEAFNKDGIRITENLDFK